MFQLHISEEDFAEAFGMSRTDFDCLPSWKQVALKKSAGLF